MWDELFVQQMPVLERVLRTVLVYAFLLALIRLAGKRGLANTNALDFIVVLLLATGVQNAIVGDDTSFTGAVVSSVTLVALNTGLAYLTIASPAAARFLEGRPTPVIENGRFEERRLRRLGMRRSELDHAIRSQNGDSIDEIEHGEVTPSGQIVLTLRESEQSATKADIAALREQLRDLQEQLAAR
jgi:uncharacterized membrane protein YcaP (DUF421 family)